ncbi:MAG: class I SAM-dependent methyltransferase [Chitinophagaceae bacterium]|nr:class I SAM-dependent methyltransferase [Chitinophagaceae bacterium]
MNSLYFNIRKKCPACASTTSKTIYKQPFDQPPIRDYLIDFYSSRGRIELSYLENGNYILEECDHCKLIFQKEIPNDQFMERLYEYWLDPQKRFEHHRKNDGLDHYLYYAQEIMQVMTYLKKQPVDLKFFDFGMGWGKWSMMAKAFGCDSYGSELSRERIKYAESNGLKVIEWNNLPDYQFNFINTEQVFEHLAEPFETLEHLKRALAPDGIIKISVPTANNIDQRLRLMNWKAKKGSKHSLNPVAPLEHINFYRRKSIIKMADKAGLKEILIPIRKQYQYMCDWSGIKRIGQNLLKPISLNLLKKQNYLFFRKTSFD